MRWLGTAIAFLGTLAQNAFSAEPDFVKQRLAMVENIRRDASSYVRELGKDGFSPEVLEVMRKTERHLFMPEDRRHLAYVDRPVPIGKGQTISQPFVVALMTHLAALKPDHVVLEVGTGSGYQAAILAGLVKKVCTIEIIRSLGEQAARTLKKLGYENVSVRIGDGYQGWKECGPFHAVIVTAALDHVPQPLIDQLKVGGRIVMPVGEQWLGQELQVIEKTGPNSTTKKSVIGIRFVPFTRKR